MVSVVGWAGDLVGVMMTADLESQVWLAVSLVIVWLLWKISRNKNSLEKMIDIQENVSRTLTDTVGGVTDLVPLTAAQQRRVRRRKTRNKAARFETPGREVGSEWVLKQHCPFSLPVLAAL